MTKNLKVSRRVSVITHFITIDSLHPTRLLNLCIFQGVDVDAMAQNPNGAANSPFAAGVPPSEKPKKVKATRGGGGGFGK